MNILVINHYAGSPKHGMEYRVYYLAREWVKLGHQVTIVASTFSHLRKENVVIERDFQEEYIDGIKYIWVKTSPYSGNGIGRIRNMFEFLYKVYFNANKLSKIIKPDAVVASSTYPADNYIVNKIARKSKAIHVFEVHDLWPLSPMEIGAMSKYHPFIILMQLAENFAYKKADRVISILPNTKGYVLEKGVSPQNWFHIPNGIVVEEWEKVDEVKSDFRKIFENQRKDGKTIIGYAGGHALSNSLDTIVDAAILLSKNPKYIFVFVGNGAEKKALKERAQGLENVIFLDPVEKSQVPHLLSYFDMLVIAWKKSPLYRFGISPNKIFDYMMASKPIIHAVEAANNFVEIAKCGVAVEPESPKAIVEAIEKISMKPESELEEMGRNAKKYILENHDYKVLASRFLQSLN